MRPDNLNLVRPWRTLVPQTLLALAMTMTSFSVFLQTERVEAPVSMVATAGEAASNLAG